MIVIVASILLLLLNPDTPAPMDTTTGKPVAHCKERIENLIKQLTKQNTKLIIPTPALSEALIKAGKAAPQYLDIMRNSRFFQISPFGPTAAVEAAELMRQRISKHGSLKADELDSRAKVKFDFQIIAIARVTRASTILTDDAGLHKLAISLGLTVMGMASLPLPAEERQGAFVLTPAADPSPDDF